mmetsp:Transcript_16854/g.31917  ORF Transcript_16854/g.31917 Transcript_16854/m.31917 type:complete len:582 (-) Transcript_16854:75-1820(-)|eukprot:CAMPEP_0176485858 /NCGR_PEP_ID=MMETSP0200_2-20121128/5263_1 /TAXON_ID=947934 /ORGANISM="Chaetoceros sp., Strain GSL56" /LENGTH=581 /DNA_ID=CAMNT_0017882529 /DNA_START=145 /DNA_END=1890 /DNA_ORIENTATION=+
MNLNSVSEQQDPYNQTTMIINSSIFGQEELGPIISTHSCSYHRQKGKLYISSDCLCYYSNILGFERKILIRIKDIKYASLFRTTSIMIRCACYIDSLHSLEGEEGQEEGLLETLEQHIFRSFNDRQGVLQIICSVYERLTGKELSNTDSFDENRYNIVDAIQDENTFATPLRKIIPRKSQDARIRRDGEAITGSVLDILVDRSDSRDGLLLDSTVLEHSRDGAVDFHEALSSPPRSRCSTLDGSILYRGHGGQDVQASLDSMPIPRNESKDATRQEWDRVCKESCTIYSELAVERKVLPISINRFYDLFLAEDAIKSMAFFQGHIIQDDGVECTCWKISDDANAELMEGYREFTRLITSRHHRNARMGPKVVPLERKQTLRRFSNFGIVLNTILNMEGVPYGDMFEMQDEWIIESCNQGEIAISVRFRIHFIKRPMAMVRKVIRDQSRKEINSWFKMYMEMLQETLGGEMEISPITTPLIKDRIKGGLLLFVQYVVGLFSSRLCSSAILCILAYSYIRVLDRINFLESALHNIQVQNDIMIEKLNVIGAKEYMQQHNWSECLADFLHDDETSQQQIVPSPY